MWHVSSRSGVATLRTAIHLLLTYLLTVAVLFEGSLRVPWLSFAKCLPLYALAAAHFTFNWGYYTLLTCLPQYFKHILHFDIKSVSADNHHQIVNVKVAHTRLPSVGFRSLSRYLAVSLQVTWVINPAVGCHYFPPGPQLPPQPISLLGEQRHDGCEQFA